MPAANGGECDGHVTRACLTTAATNGEPGKAVYSARWRRDQTAFMALEATEAGVPRATHVPTQSTHAIWHDRWRPLTQQTRRTVPGDRSLSKMGPMTRFMEEAVV